MSLKYDLYIPCAVKSCSDKSYKYWYHANCGGRVQLRDDAYLVCPKCYTSAIMFDWDFSCAGHGYKY